MIQNVGEHYLFRIKAEESAACPCRARRQTVKYTLLECPRFDDLRGDMLQAGGTDLMRLLGIPSSAVRVTKFLLATGELSQLRHIHDADAIHNGGEEAGEDSW